MNVQVKGSRVDRPVLTREGQARREAATAYWMEKIANITDSGYPDDQKIAYIRIIMHNWRSRMAQIDAGLF